MDTVSVLCRCPRRVTLPRQGRRDARIFRDFAAGMRLEPMSCGRGGSPGCVTSGRRWHHRIPDSLANVHRDAATKFTMPTRERGRCRALQRSAFGPEKPHGHSCACGRSALEPARARLLRHARRADRGAQGSAKQVRRSDHRVTGVVTRSWGMPLVPFQFYNVDDGSGEITVLSRSSRVLSAGARVQVKGRLSEIASFGTRSVGLHIEERDRSVR